MTKIEQLIKELCPNGVEYRKLQDLAEISTGSSNTNEAEEDGLYPFFVRSQEPLKKNSYEFDETAIITAGDGVGVGKVYHYVEGKYALHQRAYRIHITSQAIAPKFFFYYMKTKFFDYISKTGFHSSVSSIRRPMLNDFLVPVLPIDLQITIVQILEQYSSSVDSLLQDLEKEIADRKKQYEYYRELILDKNTEAMWVPLLDVAETYTGLTYKPADTAKSGTIVLRSSNIKSSKLVFDDNVYVQMSNIPQRAIVQENDILICVRNGSKALIGKAAMIPKTKEKMAFGAFMTILRPNNKINPKYLFFVWQSPRIQNMIHGDSGMPINQITKSMLEKIQVPLPSLKAQENIVSILDRFDKLCNDISEGLPAEIEARRKQYEYYRDRLLSFEERKNA